MHAIFYDRFGPARDVLHLNIDIESALSEQPFWDPDRVDRGVLRGLVAEVWEHWESEGEAGLMDCDEIFEFELPMAMLNIVAGPNEEMKPAQPSRQARLMTYTRKNVHGPVSSSLTKLARRPRSSRSATRPVE